MTLECVICGAAFTSRRKDGLYCSKGCSRAVEYAQKQARLRADPARRAAYNAAVRARRQENIEVARKKARDYRKRNRPMSPAESNTRRNSRLLRRYGVTLAERNAMAETQGNRCAICLEVNPGPYPLSVDHCHATGQVRELLCHRCNSALGLLRDNPALARAAADYLEKWSPDEATGLGKVIASPGD